MKVLSSPLIRCPQHEEDDGILWKHTDFRTGGRGHAVRSRKLVVSMIVTVANYEYLMYWNFYQDGNMELEIKLTGILNLYTMAEGEDAGKHGTEVSPRVIAHHHQHLFSVRIDPMIDGLANSVSETDIVAADAPTGSDEVCQEFVICSCQTKVNSSRILLEMDLRHARQFLTPVPKLSGMPIRSKAGLGQSLMRTKSTTPQSYQSATR